MKAPENPICIQIISLHIYLPFLVFYCLGKWNQSIRHIYWTLWSSLHREKYYNIIVIKEWNFLCPFPLINRDQRRFMDRPLSHSTSANLILQGKTQISALEIGSQLIPGVFLTRTMSKRTVFLIYPTISIESEWHTAKNQSMASE